MQRDGLRPGEAGAIPWREESGEPPPWKELLDTLMRNYREGVGPYDPSVMRFDFDRLARQAWRAGYDTPRVCESCETRHASKWCSGCVVEDHQAAEIARGLRPSDPQPDPVAREHSVSQLLRDALVALDSGTPHREKHARQAIERALRIAEGK